MYPLPPDLQPISSDVLQPSKFRIEFMENLMEVDQNEQVRNYALQFSGVDILRKELNIV